MAYGNESASGIGGLASVDFTSFKDPMDYLRKPREFLEYVLGTKDVRNSVTEILKPLKDAEALHPNGLDHFVSTVWSLLHVWAADARFLALAELYGQETADAYLANRFTFNDLTLTNANKLASQIVRKEEEAMDAIRRVLFPTEYITKAELEALNNR